jgi:YjbE family integral membrane protein
MSFTDLSFWSSLLSIFFINLILSGDNAVVIALATLNLKGRERRLGILFGTLGAVILRIVLTIFAAMLLKIPYVQAIGGILLIWVAVKLLLDSDSENNTRAATSLGEAIKIIIIADLIMSLDNVLAIAGISNGNILLLIIGIAISIPIVIFGSTLLSNLMKRLPFLVYLGAGLIGYTAGEMIKNEAIFKPILEIPLMEYVIPLGIAISAISAGHILKCRQRNEMITELEIKEQADSQAKEEEMQL